MEPFHMTLGVVNSTYPVKAVTQQINEQISEWTKGSIQFDRYFLDLPPRVIESS